MKRLLTAVLLTLVLLVSILSAFAQSGDGYDLTWSSVAGGGGTISGGAYTLAGTVGQPDPGLLAGGEYTLGGGFWGGGALAGEYQTYFPLVLRNAP